MTIHDALVDTVLQLLRLPVPVCSGPIGEEIDLDTLGEAELDGVRVELTGSTPDDSKFGDAGPIDWSTSLAITCAARGDDRTAGGRASRVLHNLVHQRLRADPSLGDRLYYMAAPQLAFDGQAAGTRLGTTVAVYELRHRSASNSLEA